MLTVVFGGSHMLKLPDSLSNHTLLIYEMWPEAFPQYHQEMSSKRIKKWRTRLDKMAITVNKQLKDVFKSYYSYDYKFIPHNDLKKYPKEEYPIVFYVQSYSSSTTTMTADGNMISSTATGAAYQLHNRMLRISYSRGNLLVGVVRASTIKAKRLVKKFNKCN